MNANKVKMCRQTEFIPITSMLSIQADGNVFANNAADYAEYNSLGIGAVVFNTGEEINGLLHIGSHWDRNNDIRLRVVYVSTAAATDDCDFDISYTALTPNTDAILADPATALDTTVPDDDTIGAANTIQTTDSGIIKAGTLSDDDRYLVVEITGTVIDTEVGVLGLEVEFTPKFYKGDIHEAPEWRND